MNRSAVQRADGGHGEGVRARRAALSWLACGEPQLPAGEGWLSAAERAYLAGVHFTKRRNEFRVARWAAKQAIARAAGRPAVDPARIEVRHHRSGAPAAYLDGQPLSLPISLSDRAGWAVCLAGAGVGRIGCDLELVEPRSPAFVRHYFTAAEQHCSDDLAANLVWSAKESALKVLRTGLRRDTRSVEVSAGAEPGDGGWAWLRVRASEGAIFAGWWRRFGDFVLTVAAELPSGPPVSLADPAPLTAARPVRTWLAQPVSSNRSEVPEPAGQETRKRGQ